MVIGSVLYFNIGECGNVGSLASLKGCMLISDGVGLYSLSLPTTSIYTGDVIHHSLVYHASHTNLDLVSVSVSTSFVDTSNRG